MRRKASVRSSDGIPRRRRKRSRRSNIALPKLFRYLLRSKAGHVGAAERRRRRRVLSGGCRSKPLGVSGRPDQEQPLLGSRLLGCPYPLPERKGRPSIRRPSDPRLALVLLAFADLRTSSRELLLR